MGGMRKMVAQIIKTSKIHELITYSAKPSTDLRTGLRKFAEWYAEFYK